jgi:hypothetical protein
VSSFENIWLMVLGSLLGLGYLSLAKNGKLFCRLVPLSNPDAL